MRHWPQQYPHRTRPALAILILLGLALSQASWAAAPASNPVPTTTSADPMAPAKPKAPPLPPLAPSYAPTSGDSCNLDCGRHYYFCLSGPDASQCPEQWTQCRSRCAAAPTLASPKP